MRALLALLALLAIPPVAEASAPSLATCARHEVVFGGFISVGTAELALDDCAAAGDLLGNTPKRYSITLARRITGEDLARSARRLLERNLGTEARLPAFECMNRAYRSGAAGDRYDIEWWPARGLRLRINGALAADCPAPAAGAAYFAIWFGPEPFQRQTRDALVAEALAGR